MREYDSIADWYQTDRSRTFGVAEALAIATLLPAHSRILDVGCGNGVPITEALVNAGHRVVGLDSSAGMLARFRANLPGTPIVRGDARHLPFADGSLDAAISWGMIFHLPPTGQAAVFASVSRALKPGAPFLFTGTEIEFTGTEIEGWRYGRHSHDERRDISLLCGSPLSKPDRRTWARTRKHSRPIPV